MDAAVPTTRFVRSFTAIGGTFSTSGSSRSTADLGDAWVYGRPFLLGGAASGDTDVETFLRGLDGKFSLACRRGEEWVVATDVLGCGPLYYREGPEGVSFGTHLGTLVGSGPVLIDDLGAIAVATTGICLGGQTPYQGVRRLGGGEYLVLDQTHSRVLRRGTYATLGTLFDLERTEPGDPQALADLLRAAVAREPDIEGLFLSEGLDSQAVALALPTQRRRETLAITYGGWRSPDRLRAGHVARRLGIPHRELGQRGVDPWAFWDPIVTLGAGQPGLQTSQHLVGATSGRRYVGAAMMGFLGDYLSGSKFDKYPDLAKMVGAFSHLSPANRRHLRRLEPDLVGGVDDLLRAEFHRWPQVSEKRQQLLTSLVTRQPQHISAVSTFMHHYLDISTPLVNRDLMGYLLTRDDAALKGQALYRSALQTMGYVDPSGARSSRGTAAKMLDSRGSAYMTANWAKFKERQGPRMMAAVDRIEHEPLRRVAQITHRRPMAVPLALYVLPIAAIVQPELRSLVVEG